MFAEAESEATSVESRRLESLGDSNEGEQPSGQYGEHPVNFGGRGPCDLAAAARERPIWASLELHGGADLSWAAQELRM
jgi:hypothetical protein